MRLTSALLLAAVALSVRCAEAKDNPADWPMYTRDLAGTRYSPLNQINTGNAGKLVQAWTYRLRTAPSGAPASDAAPAAESTPAGRGGRGGAGGGANPEATPIVVNGMMYLPAGN